MTHLHCSEDSVALLTRFQSAEGGSEQVDVLLLAFHVVNVVRSQLEMFFDSSEEAVNGEMIELTEFP